MREVILHTKPINCKGDCMPIDFNSLATNLLQELANSIHDRDATKKQFCFSTSEMRVAEKWLESKFKEIIVKMGEY